MKKHRSNHVIFETLSYNLCEALPRIKNSNSLLVIANELLKSEVSILVRYDSSSDNKKVSIENVYPRVRMSWVNKNINVLRWWKNFSNLNQPYRGGSLEKELIINSERFSDSLVVFGICPKKNKAPKYEMILLQSYDEEYLYSSYHTAFATTLLRHYEQIEELKLSKKSNREFTNILTNDLLIECDWHEFIQRLNKENKKQLKIVNFIGPAAILSTSMTLWNDDKNSIEDKASKPLKWLKKRRPKDKWSDFIQILEFLNKSKFFDSNLLEIVNKSEFTNSLGFKSLLMVLGHSWSLVRDAALFSSYKNNRLPNSSQIYDLLKFTVNVCAIYLQNLNGLGSDNTPIGRESLRVFFAYLLCTSPKLNKRYLWINTDDEILCRNVSKEVHREYLLNLSRYMLGTIKIMQVQNEISNNKSYVSKIEYLDSLLYSIDRFTHVQLGVDERLHVRKQLSRGFSSEISSHIRNQFYRDHLIHVIDVFLLGFILLNTYSKWKTGETSTLTEHLIKSIHTRNSKNKPSFKNVDHLIEEWAVAALFHDIGYQVDIPKDEKYTPSNFNSFFALSRPASANWLSVFQHVDYPWHQNLERLAKGLNKLSQIEELIPDQKHTFLRDHGVISALRIGQLLAQSDLEGSVLQEENSPSVNYYSDALHAIAYHNLFSKIVSFKDRPLSCLLRLCDELQEWGRRRVNIEKIVKHLYLQIEETNTEGLSGYNYLENLHSNINYYIKRANDKVEILSKIKSLRPVFNFTLAYQNPVQAQYDAISLFLSKSYNFQHIDLSESNTELPMKWNIFLKFPQPKEYVGLFENDLYGLMRERIRVLPELWQYNSNDNEYPAGLFWITDFMPNSDCIAIIIYDQANNKRKGWQTCNPDLIRENILNLKRQFLARHTLGPDERWLLKGKSSDR